MWKEPPLLSLMGVGRPLLTFGGLPPGVREPFGIPWTQNQERHLRITKAGVASVAVAAATGL